MPGPGRRPAATVLATVALVLAACQGPSAPALTDPTEILAAAARTTAEATSVRLDAAVEGRVALDILGAGAGAPIDLSGTTASADIDLAIGDARTTFNAPALLGLTGEVIAVDGALFVKSTLSGPDYVRLATGGDQPAPSASAETIVATIADLLTRPELEPVKGDDVPCGSGSCYAVRIELTPDELAALGLDDFEIPTGLPIPLPIPDLDQAAIDLTVLVTTDTNRLAGLDAEVALGDAGTIDLVVTFSKWSEPVSIVAPPPDEVSPLG